MTNPPNEPTPELLPCPFCGGAVIFKTSHVAGEGGWIEHVRYGCQVQFSCLDADENAELIKEWNTRADSRAIAAEKERDELREDGARLDWLEKQNAVRELSYGNGSGPYEITVAQFTRYISLGRCDFNLDTGEVGDVIPIPTLRQAIDAAIRAARKDHE